MKKNIQCSTILADNCDEIDFAWQKGVPKKTPIFTFSPSINLEKKYPTSFTIEDKLNIDGAKKNRLILYDFEKKIYLAIKHDVHLKKYKLSILSTIKDFENCFIRACSLNDNDFKKKIVIIKNLQFKRKFGKTIPFDWTEIVPKKKQINLLFNGDKNIKNKKSQHSFLKGLKFLLSEFFLFPRNTIVRLAVKKLSFFLKLFFNKGKILILFDNTLINDSLFYLLKKGYFPEYIKLSDLQVELKTKEINKKVVLKIKKKIVPLINDLVNKNLPKSNRKVVTTSLIRRLHYWIKQFDAGKIWWEKKIEKYKSYKKIGILSNSYMWPHTKPLQEICKKKKIKIFLCQHGIKKEITYFTNQVLDECANADISFKYNSKCLSLDNDNIFKVGRSYIVGPSLAYLKYPKKIFFKKQIDFLYIGSNRYAAGSAGVLECSDAQVAKHEISIIKILSKIPHKIYYKSYPNVKRYSDPDPVKRIISSHKNIILLNDRQNVRSLYSETKIMIMSKATSTFTWAVMTDKPIVLIDCPTQEFNENLKNLLKKSVFFFNSSEKKFENKIRNFLSKNTDEITEEYKKKIYYRKILKNYLFHVDHSSAGKKIASIIDHRI